MVCFADWQRKKLLSKRIAWPRLAAAEAVSAHPAMSSAGIEDSVSRKRREVHLPAQPLT
jgi:hypothetical protein